MPEQKTAAQPSSPARGSWLASIRQLLFPREFRIAAPQWPAAWNGEAADKWLQAAAEQLAAGASKGGDMTVPREWSRLLADLATGIWRLKLRCLEPGTDRPREEMRRAYRDVEALWDALTQAGVKVQDHKDTAYDASLSLTVVAFQPTAGIDRERVIETIKPTVYYQSQRIQMGEVIVGTPEKGK